MNKKSLQKLIPQSATMAQFMPCHTDASGFQHVKHGKTAQRDSKVYMIHSLDPRFLEGYSLNYGPFTRFICLQDFLRENRTADFLFQGDSEIGVISCDLLSRKFCEMYTDCQSCQSSPRGRKCRGSYCPWTSERGNEQKTDGVGRQAINLLREFHKTKTWPTSKRV